MTNAIYFNLAPKAVIVTDQKAYSTHFKQFHEDDCDNLSEMCLSYRETFYYDGKYFFGKYLLTREFIVSKSLKKYYL